MSTRGFDSAIGVRSITLPRAAGFISTGPKT